MTNEQLVIIIMAFYIRTSSIIGAMAIYRLSDKNEVLTKRLNEYEAKSTRQEVRLNAMLEENRDKDARLQDCNQKLQAANERANMYQEFLKEQGSK